VAVLNATVQAQVREILSSMNGFVTVAVFTRSSHGAPCDSCDDTLELAEALEALSGGRVRVEAYDLDREAATARAYRVDKAPAIAVLGGGEDRHDFGIRFFGTPAGYEFGTLIEDIRMVGAGETDLSPGTVDALAHLDRPVHLQVFVTPTCPYCPRAALLAHKLALAGERVTADAIDATEFPELADRYNVRGVPRTVVNDTIQIEGAVPEALLMSELMQTL
jgi:glutaredoxin-like protein